jgi:Predicted membrane protein
MSMKEIASERPHYAARLLAELGRMGGEHDAFIKVIIVERIIKAIVLIALAIGLLVAGRTGLLTNWANYAQDQLNLEAGHTLIVQLFLNVILYVGHFSHTTLLAIGAIVYALLEGTEGVGLAMRRRWAEYLTVIATGILIPYEAYEVIHHVTLFKIGALLLNVAVVGYLAYRKRLFVGI